MAPGATLHPGIDTADHFALQHAGPLTPARWYSALHKQKGLKGEGHRAPPSRRKKLEGMLRRERAKECYQLGLQLNAPSPRAFSELDDTERRRLKKKAISVSKHGGDKRDLLQAGACST